MRRLWIAGVAILAACGADLEEQSPPWALDEVWPDAPTTDPPDAPPAPPDEPPVDPPTDPPDEPPVAGEPVSRRGLIVLAPPCPECRVLPSFYPTGEVGGGPITPQSTGPGDGFASSCTDRDSGPWTGEPWSVQWDTTQREVVEEHARLAMYGGLMPTGARVLAVDVSGDLDGDQLRIDTIDPLLCETLRHVGVCLVPRVGDLCILATGPGSDDSPNTRVITTPTATQRGHHGLEAFDFARRVEWRGATVDLDREHGFAVHMNIDWYGSSDPFGTPEDFIPSRSPEAVIDDLRMGSSGPDVDTTLTSFDVDESVSWIALQVFLGEVDMTIASFAVMTNDPNPFTTNYLIWGATESTLRGP